MLVIIVLATLFFSDWFFSFWILLEWKLSQNLPAYPCYKFIETRRKRALLFVHPVPVFTWFFSHAIPIFCHQLSLMLIINIHRLLFVTILFLLDFFSMKMLQIFFFFDNYKYLSITLIWYAVFTRFFFYDKHWMDVMKIFKWPCWS